jgi:hypothetical protein
MHRPDPYAMAEEMGHSLLAEWRAYYNMKREIRLQDAAAARAEAGVSGRRGGR